MSGTRQESGAWRRPSRGHPDVPRRRSACADGGSAGEAGHRHDELHFARSLEDKGRLCRELAIDIFFDDQDECIVPVDERTLVCKIRNGGNFDFDERKWLSTGRLTRLL